MTLGFYAAYRGGAAAVEADRMRIDRILVRGNARLSDADVRAVLAGLEGEHIIWTDLAEWRRRLLTSTWVRDAVLRRSLPSTVEVFVSERDPIGIGRMGGSLYLVDERGTVIDDYGPGYGDLDLPIVDGLGGRTPEGDVRADAARAGLAARLIASLAAEREIAERLSQVDVTDLHNAAVILNGDPAVIHLGEDQFLSRLQSYLELSSALRERVPEIDSVDLRFDERIYVRPTSARRRVRPRNGALEAPVPGGAAVGTTLRSEQR
jgi:cell division protein FtsQ